MNHLNYLKKQLKQEIKYLQEYKKTSDSLKNKINKIIRYCTLSHKYNLDTIKELYLDIYNEYDTLSKYILYLIKIIPEPQNINNEIDLFLGERRTLTEAYRRKFRHFSGQFSNLLKYDYGILLIDVLYNLHCIERGLERDIKFTPAKLFFYLESFHECINNSRKDQEKLSDIINNNY